MTSGKYSMQLGKRIRQLRNMHDMTQSEFALTLGMSQSWVSELESGKGTKRLDVLIEIVRGYGISFDWLMGRTYIVLITSSLCERLYASSGVTHIMAIS